MKLIGMNVNVAFHLTELEKIGERKEGRFYFYAYFQPTEPVHYSFL